MVLMVKCKNCGGIFSSKIQMSDTSSWHRPILTTKVIQDCPDCGKSASYSKQDHFFQ